jgi:hypothetical protein
VTTDRIRRDLWIWITVSVGVALYAIDFYVDIRERDAFSWMDPYQYYEFSLDVVQGRAAITEFEIPSLFPFFVMPFLALDPSIAGSLWVNFAAMLLLLVGLRELARELEMKTPWPITGLLVLSSPLLIGLARTLYIEFTLTAMATFTFVLWLRYLRRLDWQSGVSFAAMFGLVYMTKTTFHLFMLAPIAGAVLGRLAERRQRDALALVAAGVLPIVMAVLIHLIFFQTSIGYYLNLVSTTRPFMYLMGPAEATSWSSLSYYFRELGQSSLYLLAPFLLLPLITFRYDARRITLASLASSRAAIWLWLLGPLLVLTAHPLKEPRHAAPTVVPAVLLIVLGLEAVERRRLREGLTALAIIVAIVQWGLVTLHKVDVPYFLDGPLHHQTLQDEMIRASSARRYRRTPTDLRTLHWKYDQNVAITGFAPNAALALSWQAFPGVVFDLDTFEDAGRISDRVPYEQFEDLYFLAAINTYNRRCGWRWYHGSLDRQTVVDNADFVILNDVDSRGWEGRFPSHTHVETIPTDGGDIHLLKSSRSTTPYRALYARAFLERNPALPDQEMRTIAEEMLIATVLGGGDARPLIREFPILNNPGVSARNIYWIGGYPALLDLTRQRIGSSE